MLFDGAITFLICLEMFDNDYDRYREQKLKAYVDKHGSAE
jgi:hypothetical protein